MNEQMNKSSCEQCMNRHVFITFIITILTMNTVAQCSSELMWNSGFIQAAFLDAISLALFSYHCDTIQIIYSYFYPNGEIYSS